MATKLVSSEYDVKPIFGVFAVLSGNNTQVFENIKERFILLVSLLNDKATSTLGKYDHDIYVTHTNTNGLDMYILTVTINTPDLLNFVALNKIDDDFIFLAKNAGFRDEAIDNNITQYLEYALQDTLVDIGFVTAFSTA